MKYTTEYYVDFLGHIMDALLSQNADTFSHGRKQTNLTGPSWNFWQRLRREAAGMVLKS